MCLLEGNVLDHALGNDILQFVFAIFTHFLTNHDTFCLWLEENTACRDDGGNRPQL